MKIIIAYQINTLRHYIDHAQITRLHLVSRKTKRTKQCRSRAWSRADPGIYYFYICSIYLLCHLLNRNIWNQRRYGNSSRAPSMLHASSCHTPDDYGRSQSEDEISILHDGSPTWMHDGSFLSLRISSREQQKTDISCRAGTKHFERTFLQTCADNLSARNPFRIAPMRQNRLNHSLNKRRGD